MWKEYRDLFDQVHASEALRMEVNHMTNQSAGGRRRATARQIVLIAAAIALLRFGMPLCFGINKQYLDIPIGVLLVVVVVARALANSPALIAKVGGLRKKKESRAGA